MRAILLAVAAAGLLAGCQPKPQITEGDLARLRIDILNEAGSNTTSQIQEALRFQKADDAKAAQQQLETEVAAEIRDAAADEKFQRDQAAADLKADWDLLGPVEQAWVKRVRKGLAKAGIEGISDDDREDIRNARCFRHLKDDLVAAMKIPRSNDSIFRRWDDFADRFKLTDDERVTLFFMTPQGVIFDYIRLGEKLLKRESLNGGEIKDIRENYPLLAAELKNYLAEKRKN